MKSELNCNTCNKKFEKDNKEIKRRLKVNPNCNFYCSLSCSGKQNAAHLIGRNPFISGSEHHKKAIQASKHKNIKYFGDIKQIRELMRRCNKRKHEVSLSLDYLMTLWESQYGRCAITNIPISLTSDDFVQMASLDRIDSSIGYIEGNVQYVSCCINLAKNNLSNQRMHDFIKLIIDNYKKE